MRTKKASILVILLVISSMVTVSSGSEVEPDDFNGDLIYLDIPAPEGLEVWKDGEDVLLNWDAVDDVDHYKVYFTQDIYSTFPIEWSYALTEDEGWNHEDVLLGEESYHYIVRGVRDDVEGRISDIGFCIAIDLTYDPNARLNYISMPANFNNNDTTTASDIVKDIEGGTDIGDADFVDRLTIWDYQVKGYDQVYGYSSLGGWGGNDFIIEPEAAVGLSLVDDLTWHVNGVQEEISMNFVDDADNNLHYINLPSTIFDYDLDGRLSASDLVRSIEGGITEENNEHITKVVKWDYTVRDYTDEYYYLDDDWNGEDFSISPGDGIGIKVQEEANFTWTPTQMDLEPPIVELLEFEDNITLHFSKEMNISSSDGAVYLDGELADLYWDDKYTMHVELNSNSTGELIIEASLTDTYGNTLDGNGDGVSLGPSFDDFVYELPTAEEDEPELSKPEIGHIEAPETIILGDTSEIKVNVTTAESVYLNYTFLNLEHNITMDGNGTYTYTIPASWDTGIMEYHIAAVDEHGIWNRSVDSIIEFIDPGISSSIVHTQGTNRTCKTENITIEVSTDYPIDPDNILISYIYTDNTEHNADMLNRSDRWFYSIPPQNRSGVLEYRFTFQYHEGPTITSDNYTITVDNPLEVEFKEINGEEDTPLDFEVSISSPVGVQEATLHYEINGSPKSSSLMLEEGDPGEGVWVTTITADEGILDYHVRIVDMNGEVDLISSSEPIQVDAAPSSLPILYLLPLVVIASVALAAVMLKRKDPESTVYTTDSSPAVEEPEEDQPVDSECTICFGNLDENEAMDCPGCGNSYHPNCLHQLGECPVCGGDPHSE